MVNKMADNEKLSALMDGESVDKAFIRELTQDAESQQSWRHYHLIGDVMRGENVQKEWNIADSVALALENEAPHSLFSTQDDVSLSDVVPIESQPEPQQARKRLPSWLAHLGQVSIAASVCLAVVLGVQQNASDEAHALDQAIPVLQTVPLAGVAEPVSLTRESVEKQQMSETNVQEQRRRINALLQDYELQLRLNSDAIAEVSPVQEPIVE
jgi:sigma-E factor negative regulatory protein RseA